MKILICSPLLNEKEAKRPPLDPSTSFKDPARTFHRKFGPFIGVAPAHLTPNDRGLDRVSRSSPTVIPSGKGENSLRDTLLRRRVLAAFVLAAGARERRHTVVRVAEQTL